MCEALESLKTALVAKYPIVALDCPNCNFPHLDVDDVASNPHSTHLCLACNERFKMPVAAVSNPLAWLNPVL